MPMHISDHQAVLQLLQGLWNQDMSGNTNRSRHTHLAYSGYLGVLFCLAVCRLGLPYRTDSGQPLSQHVSTVDVTHQMGGLSLLDGPVATITTISVDGLQHGF